MCKHDSELNMKVNHLAIGSVPNKDYESLELKTARVAPQHQMNESQPLLEKNKTSVSLEKVPIELLGMVRICLLQPCYFTRIQTTHFVSLIQLLFVIDDVWIFVTFGIYCTHFHNLSRL